MRGTDVCDDGEIADSFDDDQPPVDWVCFDREDSLFEVDNLIFWGVKSYDSGDEHHGVGEWQSRSKESCSCEDIDNGHVALPRVVKFFIVHVTRHLVLLLVECIDGFKETKVELRYFLLLSALKIVVDLEHDEGNYRTNNRSGHINHDDREKLRWDEIIAILYPE